MKTIIPLFLLVFYTALIVKAENEPNNTSATANVLTLNGSDNGNLTDPDNEDWWKIIITVDGRLTINTTNTPSGQFYVRLFDSNATTELANSFKYSDGSGGTITYSLMPNTYYIKIERYAGSTNYSVISSLIPAPFTNDIENNDASINASIINQNDSLTGHLGYHTNGWTDNSDWWKITTNTDGKLTINTTNENTLQYYVRLYDADGTTELANSFKYYDGSGGIINYSLMSGNYFIKIEIYSGNGSYCIKTPLTPATFTNDNENNDTPNNANTISTNDSLTGHLGHHNIGWTDNSDWWKITPATDGRLTINTTTENTLQYWVRLYDADTVTQLDYSFKYSDNSGGTINYSLMPGTYFIKIELYTGYGSYSIKTPFVNATFTNDIENNDTPDNPNTINTNDSLTGHLGYHTNGLTDDSDWRKITPATDGRLTINTTTENTLQYWVRLYDADTATQLDYSFKYSDNSGGTINYSLMPGTYFIKIERYLGYGSYSVKTHYTLPVLPNDNENNDLPNNANIISPNDSLSGHLGYHTVGWTDNSDWWKVNTTIDGKLSINTTNENTLQYNVRLYSSDTTTQLDYAFKYSDGSGGTINYCCILPPNTYFIKIEHYSGYGSYNVKTSFRPLPIAKFGYIGCINNFSFIDSSLYATSYLWDFGDGTTSTLANPQHTYQQPGVYNVCLIASNTVGPDTVYSYANVKGIKNVYVNKAGNTGDATVYVYGGGFTTDTKFKLTRSGYPDIVGDTVIIPCVGAIRTTFDLRSKQPGLWNVVVNIPGDTIMTLVDGFTIETGVPANPWVNIIGRDKILFNRSQTYDITYGNSANVDASGVPLWIVVSRGTGIDVSFQGFELELPKVAIDSGWTNIRDSIPVYIDVDSLFGEAFKARIYGFYIPIIPAGQTETVKMIVHSNQDVRVMAWVNTPYFQSPLSQDYKTCVALAAAKLLASGIGLVSPIDGCVHSVVTNYIYDPWSYKQPQVNTPKTWGSSLWNLATTALSCAGAFTPMGVALNFAVNLTNLAADFQSAWGAANACKDAYGQKSRKDKSVKAVSSFDPNEIIGLSGYTSNRYSLKDESYPYTIFFENLPTASAPAQEVFVTDTLDLNVFDIKRFGFGQITFGDSVVSPLSDQYEFTKDIDLRPTKNIILRIDAKLDTTDAVIRWHFASFDPANMNITEDPMGGFLPPNVISPEGEGSVSFYVGLKTNLVNNTQIKNKASIVFDFNPAINTNQWMNTLDLIKPESSVSPLAAVINDTVFELNWSGADDGSGVRNYTIYVSKNDSANTAWKAYTSATSAYFTGQYGNKYKFYSIAYDSLGHIENDHATYDAVTQLLLSIPEKDLNPNSLRIFPNPANNYANVEFELAYPEKVILKVTDILGREVILPRNEYLVAGIHRISIKTIELKTGIYFLNLQTEKYSTTQKFNIIK
ncbi:MAG: T9SS type A sorting domain-containing protein [Bacteroidetes bacterium]|nr:T9SS type A sorting domain-containing protein [Bacteroidota bacterium]